MKLSIVIPAYNEESCIESTVTALNDELRKENIPHEILIVNDNSSDRTPEILKRLSTDREEIRFITNFPPHNGFGFAIRKGLENFIGDVVAIYMADASDLPQDVVRFYAKIVEGADCCFGNRWSKGGNVVDYPKHKLYLNRFTNYFISLLFQMRYLDTTNAFKMYRREVIEGLKPFLSHHFNLTVELPLKAMIRGYSYAVVPNTWINRTTGVSKLKIKEMGSRYLFIIIYCFIEKWLSRGDYKRSDLSTVSD